MTRKTAGVVKNETGTRDWGPLDFPSTRSARSGSLGVNWELFLEGRFAVYEHFKIGVFFDFLALQAAFER